ncbi:GH92 family glycosyl hydrolase [Kutzneria chonburiensis]|uniref:GH92 family glycosyl hydrolase n=1 Tax=Kutzneria chonburiensis TaxID=1483604 RepID=A0ABV6N7G0_9PSEU|nr:GH92 family glycosyl hydrolase [Kutzneria chonburiensis]
MRRLWLLLLSTALIAGLTATVPAVASAAGATDFSSSFEAGQPQPNWTDTVETDASGTPRASGVNGADATTIPGNVDDKVVDVQANAENDGAGEVKENLVDGNVNTKWLTFTSTGWAQFQLSEPIAIVQYALASANDAPGRDPQNWTLSGSQDGKSWTTLDTQTGQSFESRQQTKSYPLANTTAYLYYRLDITQNHGDPIVQLAEVQLIEKVGDTPPAPTMRSFAGKGPTGGYNSKANVGFTGVRSFRYAGSHLGDGHAYSYNKIFDVDLAVAKDTQLSYQIFPDLIGDDAQYTSTYAAVDLAFSDGTYLSRLGALDQHGFTLSPQGQGASKSLYTNQWNHIASTIGTVAAGKTIKRILIGYDKPTGPGAFGGWIDDISIAGNPAQPSHTHLSDYVSTVRGTNASGSFSRGNNFPATAVPHGFNFWTPMTNGGSQDWIYQYAKNNNAQNLTPVQSFAVSHEPSPWMGDRQTFQVMPGTAASADRGGRALYFSHNDEIAQPDYYSVKFQNGMRTEITPTDHAAMFRFTFTGDQSVVDFDNVNNNGGLTLDPADGVATGYSDVRSGLSTGATRMFVYATFDKPVTAGAKITGTGRDNVTGYFQFDTGADKTVTMRIATSLISVDQAKKNLEQEISGSDTFDAVRARAQQAWDKQLGVITVDGASQDQLVTLYSNLYRLFLYPNEAYENTGTTASPKYQYASPVSPLVGANTPTQTGAKISDGTMYVNNGFWDTARTTWPAYSLLTPSMEGKMIDGFVNQYKDGGWTSRWSSPGYADLMTGTSSDVAFADAFVKGINNFDVQAAYDAAVKNATVAPTSSGVGRKGLDTSNFLGYTSTATGEGFSWAMEGYVNDYGIAQMSKALLDKAKSNDPRRQEYADNYTYFLNRAQNYVNLFDPSVNFFQGRNPDGSEHTPAASYDPRVWGGDYTETDGWNMAFSVPQDGQGLANLYGGKDKLAAKLDTFFSTPETAKFTGSYGGVIHEMLEARDVRMGQYGGSNQPSHGILYMYDYAGQPYKTQAYVREALSRLYTGSENGQGYPGDEDNGEMSAWYIFGALGFYPLAMGSGDYAIGSPLFTKATIHLENGKSLVVNAPKNNAKNVYVQGLKVNGKAYAKTSLPSSLLAAGGTLDFDMGPNPSKWGTGSGDAPVSITKGDAVAQPLHDLTDPKQGALFDNTSNTQSTVDGAVSVQPSDPKQPVQMYTLTSGSQAAAAPASWALKGSYDGTTWTTIDQRSGVKFTDARQTKAFSVGKAGRYNYYRLETTGTLSEVELLGKPNPVCATTIDGTVNGPLTVKGVTCVTGTVNGPVTVSPGASLYAFGGAIGGPVSASGAAAVVLLGTHVSGPVSIVGTTGETSIETARVDGPVSLTNNAGAVVTATTVGGPLACTGNTPAPADNGLADTVGGPAAGQCSTLTT